MADVYVTVKNNSGHTVALTLDDERDAERIEYLQKLAKKDDLESVKVTKAPAPRKSES